MATSKRALEPFEVKSESIEGLHLGERREKGRGCYGAVYEVQVNGLPCIAKRLHDILVGRGDQETVREEDVRAVVNRFREECSLLSSLRNPNVVQFMGVHFGRDEADISLIMEYMHMDLEHCMKTYPDIPLPYKTSILRDVAYGLAYLHSLNIIHRDLNTGNILLTESLRAKVADLGVAKLFDRDTTMKRTSTICPGAHDFMPPESLEESPKYCAKLDVFSFGHLTVYLVNQKAPLVITTHISVEDVQRKQVQVGMRRRPLDQMGGSHHPLYSIAVQCLGDTPAQRPTSSDLVKRMKEICKQHPVPYENALAMLHVSGEKGLANELRATLSRKNHQIAELSQALTTKDRQLAEQRETLEEKESELIKLRQALKARDCSIMQDRETRAKHTSQVSDMRAHQAMGGSPCNHSIPSATLPQERRNGHKPIFTWGWLRAFMDNSDLGKRSEGDKDSGVGSKTQLDTVEGAKPLLARATSNGTGQQPKGKALKEKIKQAYKWKDRFYQPTQEFLVLMDNLFMECQVHLTLMSTKATAESRAEADTLVEEMIALRNHWGTNLLPVTTCNAFVRERISLTIGLQQYRIDCAQFFEPVPFQTGATQPLAQTMKLFRFSVYDLGKNEIVLRYYLEQSNTANLYHALCYVTSNTKAQVRAYGKVRPGYWEMRQHMLTDVCSRLNSPLTRPRLQ